ncbi:S-methyl-5-thioribose-1-phosphate isomerase [bacterium]|nr:S-methyl-5-thioribose-1-phosphate isomerase [bacterium]
MPALPAGIPRNLAYARGCLRLLDQTLLPAAERYPHCRDLAAVTEAIGSLRVRGAPAIGIAAAYGLCVDLAAALAEAPPLSPEAAAHRLAGARAALLATRPTAANLAAALAAMAAAERRVLAAGAGAPALLAALEAAAHAWHADDAARCAAIAAAGLAALPEPARILTHCNAGPLATGGVGTALGVVLAGHAAGRRFAVWVNETRPLLQGARITAWELTRAGVPPTLQVDGAAASLIVAGGVDAVIVGADRIAANGDTANKVGTLPLALACAHAGVPFYVAAPLSTVDLRCQTGRDIPIEERGGAELLPDGGAPWAPSGLALRNPAFDVTPAGFVTAFFTERGRVGPPYDSAAFG